MSDTLYHKFQNVSYNYEGFESRPEQFNNAWTPLFSTLQ